MKSDEVFQIEIGNTLIKKWEFDESGVKKQGDKLILDVHNVDGDVDIAFNGILIQNLDRPNIPYSEGVIDLSQRIISGQNQLTVKLEKNKDQYKNPWHIKYNLELNNQIIVEVNRKGNFGHGLVFNFNI